MLPSASTASSRGAGVQVLEMQRRRLMSATVEVIFEHGVNTLSVAMVCERAGVSRRTFYEIYDGLEELFASVFDDAVQRARQIVLDSAEEERSWRERVRTGLCALLCFFDREPASGSLLVVEALAAGTPTLHARRHVLQELATVLDQARVETKTGGESHPLTAEGIVGAVLAVIHARMLSNERESLMVLLNPLMAMIVQPYLGPAVARRELKRPIPVGRPVHSRPPSDPFKELPIRLTYRTVRALSAINTNPGSSNKQVADAAGVNDVGQTSKLLHRLQRYGLIEDSGIGPTKGQPRAWSLTQRGHGILHAVGEA